MNAEHEKEIVTQTDTFERRQIASSADHEKGPRDQEFPISQVGQLLNGRKGDASANECKTRVPARSGWFDDATKEIGDAPSRSQFERGWIYRRTETGHRREWTHNRDSVP